MLIGWWRALLSVYPWPSYLLISPPYSNPPPPIGLQCTLPPSQTTPFPSASLLKNNSDLIWLSPSHCQGPYERCKTLQSKTWLKVTERIDVLTVFSLQLFCDFTSKIRDRNSGWEWEKKKNRGPLDYRQKRAWCTRARTISSVDSPQPQVLLANFHLNPLYNTDSVPYQKCVQELF